MSQDLRKAFENVSSTNMDDAQIPQQIRLFLKKHFESFQFKARKRRYILLRKRKQSDILDHLIQSYALINFWQFMFLGMVEESDHSFQLVKKSLEDFVVKMLKISGKQTNATQPTPVTWNLNVDQRRRDRLVSGEIQVYMDMGLHFATLWAGKKEIKKKKL